MTDTKSTTLMDTEVIAEALSVIDRTLSQLAHRELVSTVEMSDMLLDVRSLLTTTN
jgi:hypothetical protein